MRTVLSALILSLSALAANAQDTAEGFQQRALSTAATPGGTRIPILCGGLFRSLAVIFDQDEVAQASFYERENVVSDIGIAVHMMDTGLEKDAATSFIAEKTSLVTAVYLEWFTFNLETEQDHISDKIRENYRFCDDQYTKWTTVDSEN